MLPQATLSHASSGRLRYYIFSKRRDVGFFSGVRDNLVKLKGVQSVDVNPFTGSVLVSTHLAPEKISAYAQRHAIFHVTEVTSSKKPVRVLERLAAGYGRLNDKVLKSTGGQVDLSTVAFLGYIGAGVYQLTHGKVMPAGIALLNSALNIVTFQHNENLEDESAHQHASVEHAPEHSAT